MGIVSVAARIGGIMAPFIIMLGDYVPNLHFRFVINILTFTKAFFKSLKDRTFIFNAMKILLFWFVLIGHTKLFFCIYMIDYLNWGAKINAPLIHMKGLLFSKLMPSQNRQYVLKYFYFPLQNTCKYDVAYFRFKWYIFWNLILFFSFLGLMTFSAGLLNMKLPETLGKPMPETIDDILALRTTEVTFFWKKKIFKANNGVNDNLILTD